MTQLTRRPLADDLEAFTPSADPVGGLDRSDPPTRLERDGMDGDPLSAFTEWAENTDEAAWRDL